MISGSSRLNISNFKAVSFTTNILIVGGAYAGLSAINTFVNQFREKVDKFPNTFRDNHISITLIEPRAGLLNVLGMPRCIVDEEFSKTQFIPMNKIKNLKFDRVMSKDMKFLNDMVEETKVSKNHDIGLDLNFVHGKVTYLDENKASYQLSSEDSEDTEEAIIDFDYVILASGRDRNFPTTPKAYSYDYFLNEMRLSKRSIVEHDVITIIGAGAVGIELAGDFKHFLPNKTINLVHPHGDLPPESALSKEFKDLTIESIKASGINLFLNTRVNVGDDKNVDRGITTGDLVTTDGTTIKSDLNIWCNRHQNNTSFLSSSLQKKFKTEKNCIKVNEYLQLHNKETGETIPTFFVLGDLVDLNIIKSAGWALYFGRVVANNLSSLLLEDKLVEPLADIDQTPKGMVLVAGNGELICELSGVVSKNVPDYVAEYRDYCFGKIMATIGI